MEGGEGLYLPNFQTNLVIALYTPSKHRSLPLGQIRAFIFHLPLAAVLPVLCHEAQLNVLSLEFDHEITKNLIGGAVTVARLRNNVKNRQN